MWLNKCLFISFTCSKTELKVNKIHVYVYIINIYTLYIYIHNKIQYIILIISIIKDIIPVVKLLEIIQTGPK